MSRGSKKQGLTFFHTLTSMDEALTFLALVLYFFKNLSSPLQLPIDLKNSLSSTNDFCPHLIIKNVNIVTLIHE